jgi:uncharacterized protein YndB with AHSA1/START domain
MRLLTCVLCLLIAATFIAAQDAPPAPSTATPAIKHGEYWYGMYLPDGTTEGYARIHAAAADVGGTRVEWELHIAYEGGSYEEERTVTHDTQNRLRYSRMKTGKSTIEGEVSGYDSKEGPVIKGAADKGERKELSVLVKADATTGMGFVLAPGLKLETGAELKRTEYNEADNFSESGTLTLTVEDREEVEVPAGKFNAWKVLVKRSKSTTSVWVSEDRRIVQVDWGTNNLMKLHGEPTKELFKPEPLPYTELEPDNAKQLKLSGDFPGFTLDEMWKHWTTNELMAKWWPQEADIEAKVGGKFIMMWKDEEGADVWTLDGKITALEERRKLGFSWKWRQMPDDAELEVTVEFSEIEGGVRLKVTHGTYADVEAKEGSGHLEGWQFFGTKLKNLKKK